MLNRNQHRVLICGFGSIGKRHASNLLMLGFTKIALYRHNASSRECNGFDFPVFNHLHEALTQWGPNIALITNPSAYHVDTALECANAGCHLFIEKPVSCGKDRVLDLISLVESRNLMAMVGFMHRFHPFFIRARDILSERILGKPVYVRSIWGEHIADWHPEEDYRLSYSTSMELGGGPALTLSHDLDLLIWLFGNPEKSVKLENVASDLDLNCAHAVDFLLEFPTGVTANVHLDYFQRPPCRQWELVCSNGRLQIDILDGKMQMWHAGRHQEGAGAHEVILLDSNFTRNSMFLDELRYFFDCIKQGIQPNPTIEEALASVKIATT